MAELTQRRSSLRRRPEVSTPTGSPITHRTLRRLAVASLVANVAIVVTGGAVRLTSSGLGCPTWPRCTDESFVVQGELGWHGALEFGNRMLTGLLAVVAFATWVAAMRYRPRRSSLRWLATGLAVGVPAQALIGGVTVLTGLNPWTVSLHLLLSLAMIGLAVLFIRRVDEADEPSRPTVPHAVRVLAQLTFGVCWLVLYVGTVLTGAGPHAGDAEAPRNGLRPALVSQIHADLVFLLVGLTIATVLSFKAVGAPQRAQRAATWLLVLEVAQGVVGFVQYFTDLPVLLVGAHLLGAALVSAAVTWMLLGVRDRGSSERVTT
ncbi:MAG: heme A synthase [Nocardioidaceae bacterium]|nr:heme A synthase [Nocardioidaceae bacterium]